MQFVNQPAIGEYFFSNDGPQREYAFGMNHHVSQYVPSFFSALAQLNSFEDVLKVLEVLFGKTDAFRILFREGDSSGHMWAPMIVLPLLVTAALFWRSKIRMTAVSFFISAIGLPLSCAYFYDPSSAMRNTTTSMFEDPRGTFTLVFPNTFSPYYVVYPTTQILLILVAIAGLLGYSPVGKARFILSVLATVVGVSSACVCAKLNGVFKDKWGVELPGTIYGIFLDQIFLSYAFILSLVASCLGKNYGDRIRLIHGSVIMYDLCKLWCIRRAEGKLVAPHFFATPALLAINTFELWRQKTRDAQNEETQYTKAYQTVVVPAVAHNHAVFSPPQVVLAYPQV